MCALQFGQAGLHWAAIKDHPGVVSWILDLGADINELDGDVCNKSRACH